MAYLALSLTKPEDFVCKGGFAANNLHITLFHFPWDDRLICKRVMELVLECLQTVKCNRAAQGTSTNYFGKDHKFVVLEVYSDWIYKYRDELSKKLRENEIVYSTTWPFSAHITLGKKDEIDITDALCLQNSKIILNRIEMCNRLEVFDYLEL